MLPFSKLGVLICAFATIVGTQAEAAERRPDDDGGVLVIKAATDADTAGRELQFIDEMQLVFDSIPIRVVDAPDDDFAGRSLGEQIVWVESVLARDDSVAAVWITPVSEERLLLHLIVTKTNRTIARMIQVDASEGFETDLAMYARESLGEALLFSQQAAIEAEGVAVAEVVDEVRDKALAAVTKEAMEEEEPAFLWRVWGAPVVEGNIVSGEGPPLLVGGGLGLDRFIGEGFGARVELLVLGGPFGTQTEDADIWRLSLVPGIGAFYLWELGRFSLGPSINLQAMYTHMTIEVGEAETTLSKLWRFRAGASLEARAELGRHLEFYLSAGAVVSPKKDDYLGQDTDRRIYSTSHLSWRAALGLSLRL